MFHQSTLSENFLGRKKATDSEETNEELHNIRDIEDTRDPSTVGQLSDCKTDWWIDDGEFQLLDSAQDRLAKYFNIC